MHWFLRVWVADSVDGHLQPSSHGLILAEFEPEGARILLIHLLLDPVHEGLVGSESTVSDSHDRGCIRVVDHGLEHFAEAASHLYKNLNLINRRLGPTNLRQQKRVTPEGIEPPTFRSGVECATNCAKESDSRT